MRDRAEDLIRQAWERLYPRELLNDPQYAYQANVLRDVVLRLDAILDDEQISDEQAMRIMRSLLYGQPSAADGYQRIGERRETVERLMKEPPGPLLLDADKAKGWLSGRRE